MSEDAAFRRAKAARIVRRHPEVREAIAKGEIHLTGVHMIAPLLGGEHHEEVLRRSRFRSKRELCRLIAEMDPKPAVPALVEPIGPAPAAPASYAAHVESMAGAVRELPEGSRPEDWIDESEPETHEAWVDEARADEARSPGTDRPLHHKVQFTASQKFVDLLEEAVALLGHESPRPALPDVQLRALELLVAKLRKDRRGEREREREQSEPAKAAGGAVAKRAAGGKSPLEPNREPGFDGTAPARVLPARDERPRRDHETQGRYVPEASGASFGTATALGAPTPTTGASGAARPPGSSSIIVTLTLSGDRTRTTTSSSAAGRTTHSLRRRISGESTWAAGAPRVSN